MNRIFKAASALLLSVLFSVAKAETTLVPIEDEIVGAPYEVVEVDGKPPQRAQHGLFVTVVPLVLVSSGSHVLTITSKEEQTTKPKIGKESLLVTVQAGKRYRLARNNGKPLIVEIQ
jgi:hypothetical protein